MTVDKNKSNFEEKIFDKLYDFVDTLKTKRAEEYKGWGDFFKFYFETYIAFAKCCYKIGMLTTNNILGNFFRRYNYHLWIDMLGPILSTKELLRCIKPSRYTKEDTDYIVYYDNGVITQNGNVLYPEGGRIPSDAISCFRSIDNYESRYFSTKEFIEYYNKKENKIDFESILEELFECLCFKNYDILDNVVSEVCEDIEEIYPYLVDSAVEQYNKQMNYDTKRIAAYADLCKDYSTNEVPSKAWERLYLRDLQVLKALMNHNINEIDSATRSIYYDIGDLLFIQENDSIAEFLYDIYIDKSLFLYECKKIDCNSLFFDAMQDLSEDNYDTLFYWIHRCNLIKAERDAGLSKMKQYIEFIRNGKAERGIDIINYMVGNEPNDEDVLEILMKEKEESISFNKNGIKATQNETQTLEVEEVKDAPLKSSAPRGPRKKFLFIQDGIDTKENEAVKHSEKVRLCSYLSQHCLKSRKLVCTKEDTLNKTIVCFLLKWMEKGLTAEEPSGGAVFRFLTEDCGIVSEVQERTYGNRVKEWIKDKSSYDTEVMLMVKDAFK